MASEQNSVQAPDCEICNGPLQVQEGKTTTCERCGHRDHRWRHRSSRLCLAFSLTALIFYIPANVFPFMTIEMYGNRNTSTIWDGVVTLLEQRSYFVAAVVFLASVLIPILKLVILIYLSMTGDNGKHPKFKMQLYQFVEAIGRWSMLDIFLLAILVAVIKLSSWTMVETERGASMFLVVVIFTMMASAYFDPKILWENYEQNDENSNSAN